MTLTLNYRSSRAEVWRWYWRAWCQPRGLWRFHLSLFILVAGILLWGWAGSRPLTANDLVLSATIGLLAVAWLPLWPLIQFKPQERVLTFDEHGASTTIGPKSGTVLWRDVARIDDIGGIIAITRKNVNAFLIPNRAF